ncbi:hypothetical protein AKJ16_DCAP02818 [Drosera capensis]
MAVNTSPAPALSPSPAPWKSISAPLRFLFLSSSAILLLFFSILSSSPFSSCTCPSSPISAAGVVAGGGGGGGGERVLTSKEDVEWVKDQIRVNGLQMGENVLRKGINPRTRARQHEDLRNFKGISHYEGEEADNHIALPCPGELLVEEHHSNYGEPWAGGRDVFEFLAESTHLSPDAQVLEIGCGTLRVGAHFIRYLKPEHYHCLERDELSLMAMFRYELPAQGLLHKRPLIVKVEDMDLIRGVLPGATWSICVAPAALSLDEGLDPKALQYRQPPFRLTHSEVCCIEVAMMLDDQQVQKSFPPSCCVVWQKGSFRRHHMTMSLLLLQVLGRWYPHHVTPSRMLSELCLVSSVVALLLHSAVDHKFVCTQMEEGLRHRHNHMVVSTPCDAIKDAVGAVLGFNVGWGSTSGAAWSVPLSAQERVNLLIIEQKFSSRPEKIMACYCSYQFLRSEGNQLSTKQVAEETETIRKY